MPPEAPIQRIQPWPQGQPQQDHGQLTAGAGALGDRHQTGEDAILLGEVAREVVKVIEQRARVDESAQLGPRLAQGVELRLHGKELKGLHEVRMKRLPEGAHGTPASRPGVQRLVLAKSGRRAPLRFSEIGESALGGGAVGLHSARAAQFIERSAAPACRGNG